MSISLAVTSLRDKPRASPRATRVLSQGKKGRARGRVFSPVYVTPLGKGHRLLNCLLGSCFCDGHMPACCDEAVSAKVRAGIMISAGRLGAKNGNFSIRPIAAGGIPPHTRGSQLLSRPSRHKFDGLLVSGPGTGAGFGIILITI